MGGNFTYEWLMKCVWRKKKVIQCSGLFHQVLIGIHLQFSSTAEVRYLIPQFLATKAGCEDAAQYHKPLPTVYHHPDGYKKLLSAPAYAVCCLPDNMGFWICNHLWLLSPGWHGILNLYLYLWLSSSGATWKVEYVGAFTLCLPTIPRSKILSVYVMGIYKIFCPHDLWP